MKLGFFEVSIYNFYLKIALYYSGFKLLSDDSEYK